MPRTFHFAPQSPADQTCCSQRAWFLTFRSWAIDRWSSGRARDVVRTKSWRSKATSRSDALIQRRAAGRGPELRPSSLKSPLQSCHSPCSPALVAVMQSYSSRIGLRRLQLTPACRCECRSTMCFGLRCGADGAKSSCSRCVFVDGVLQQRIMQRVAASRLLHRAANGYSPVGVREEVTDGPINGNAVVSMLYKAATPQAGHEKERLPSSSVSFATRRPWTSSVRARHRTQSSRAGTPRSFIAMRLTEGGRQEPRGVPLVLACSTGREGRGRPVRWTRLSIGLDALTF